MAKLRGTVFLGVLTVLAVVAPYHRVRAENALPKPDSGRYSFDGSCVQDREFLDCKVILTDMVYDTVLSETKLSTMPTNGGGGLGSMMVFEGNPAQGTAKRIQIGLNPPQASPAGTTARFTVEVSEAGHVVERYALAFPVTKR